MPIAQTWVEYELENGEFSIVNNDISSLDFGDIAIGSDVTKYIGLRNLGNSSTAISLWNPGTYADVCPYDVNLPILYEQDVSDRIIVYGRLVDKINPSDYNYSTVDCTSIALAELGGRDWTGTIGVVGDGQRAAAFFIDPTTSYIISSIEVNYGVVPKGLYVDTSFNVDTVSYTSAFIGADNVAKSISAAELNTGTINFKFRIEQSPHTSVDFWTDFIKATIPNPNLPVNSIIHGFIWEVVLQANTVTQDVLLDGVRVNIYYSAPMPDSDDPLILTNDITADYLNEGYSDQILELNIKVNSGLSSDDPYINHCYYRGLRLMLKYDTV